MSSALLRVAVRGAPSTLLRGSSSGVVFARPGAAALAAARPSSVTGVANLPSFSTSVVRSSGDRHEETFEEFTARYEKEFESVQDVFELQRNLNNAFAYDLVPAPSVIVAAVKAARRVNDFATAVRVFEAIKAKVENPGQYNQYLEELKPLREEFGILLQEEMYPSEKK